MANFNVPPATKRPPRRPFACGNKTAQPTPLWARAWPATFNFRRKSQSSGLAGILPGIKAQEHEHTDGKKYCRIKPCKIVQNGRHHAILLTAERDAVSVCSSRSSFSTEFLQENHPFILQRTNRAQEYRGCERRQNAKSRERAPAFANRPERRSIRA